MRCRAGSTRSAADARSAHAVRKALLLSALCGGACFCCGEDRTVIVGRIHVPAAADAAPAFTRDAAVAAPSQMNSADAASAAIPPAAPSDSPDGQTADGSLEAGVTEYAPEAGASADASEPSSMCSPPTALHLYRFAGADSQVPDLTGQAPAQLFGGATLNTSGVLVLDGEDDYVQFPARLLVGLSDATLTTWVAHDGGPAYVRVFDFGNGSAGANPAEGSASVGRSYVSLTPATGFELSGLAALLSAGGSADEVNLTTDLDLGDDEMHHVALVLAAARAQSELYFDGVLAASAALPFALSEIDDVNNWLGRSQYDADPYFEGRYAEFAIFNTALTACQIQSQWRAGAPAP